MDHQLMVICSLSKVSESEAIVMTIERNAAKFAKVVDAICEKWNQLTPCSVVVKYCVPDQSVGACHVTLANDTDVTNMYDLHKSLNAPVVRMSVTVKEPTGGEPCTHVRSRMAKLDMNCENCKQHAEHLYWDHKDVNGVSFFKAMTGDISRGLQLPKKFVNRFRGEFSKNTNLKGPGGDTWPIELAKTRNGTIFQSGWKEFVEAHNIEENDILFFTYVGNSCFDIVICDVSCCEKTTSYYAKNKGPVKRERSKDPLINRRQVIRCCSSSSSHDDRPRELSLSPPNSSPKKNKHAANEDQMWGSCSRTKLGRSAQLSRSDPKCRRGKKSNIGGSEQRVQQESLEKNIDKALILDHPNTHVSRKLLLSDEEQKRALQLVDAVQTANPCFLTAMRHNMVHGTCFVNVPSGFKAYLPSRCCYVFLQVPGRQKKWNVNVLVNRPQLGFSRGWRAFSAQNNLQMGDICLFEMISTHEDVVITVHIDRLAK